MNMHTYLLGIVSKRTKHGHLPDGRLLCACSAHEVRTFRRHRSCAVAAPPACAYSALHRLKTCGPLVVAGSSHFTTTHAQLIP